MYAHIFFADFFDILKCIPNVFCIMGASTRVWIVALLMKLDDTPRFAAGLCSAEMEMLK
jgi:hypothetical protein